MRIEISLRFVALFFVLSLHSGKLEDRISVIGYGSKIPLYSKEDISKYSILNRDLVEIAHRKNRRVTIRSLVWIIIHQSWFQDEV